MSVPLLVFNVLVGVVGLEPTTSWSQTKRANPTAPHSDMLGLAVRVELTTYNLQGCPIDRYGTLASGVLSWSRTRYARFFGAALYR